MKHQVRITAKYRNEPDYGKLARALLSIAERLQAEDEAGASKNRAGQQTPKPVPAETEAPSEATS